MTTTNQTTSADAAPRHEPGFLAIHQASVSAAFAGLDRALEAARPVDAKTDKLIRFALSIQARSEPCVRSHLAGAAEAGASEAEIGYVLALTMRQAAGADECWTHGILSDLAPMTELEDDNDLCSCCG